jgi:L-serine dehydratase
MRSIREVYRIGPGPSSSHTMGPSNAARSFQAATPAAARYRVTLYGSLAATGRGHLTDRAVIEALAPAEVELLWRPKEQLPRHPNALYFEALDHADRRITAWTAYSTGGGAVVGDEQVQMTEEEHTRYPFTTMRSILPYIEAEGLTLWEYVLAQEDSDIEEYLAEVWQAMQKAIERGLEEEGRLPGGLKLRRKAPSFAMKSRNAQGFISQIGTLFSYALAVSEENAGGGEVVTAPTCGSCGVLPAVLRSLQESYGFSNTRIIRALATAGLIGNIVKTHGSISGAEVGCQGEVGTACAMAAAATAQLLGGGPRQIEYAAEMGLEHHLGLTCDPVMGLVQVPCIERNAVAATRAVDAGTFATLSDGNHLISLDEVIDTMVQTGRDMASSYRETAEGGLARFYNRDELEAHARLGRMS